jgi:NitT/TauT family transport system ATP-binding protein
MITLSGVSRRFRRADGQTVSAVHEVSLSVPEGQFVCIVGPSGCGKSTLLQLVAGLLQPSSGRVAVAGAVVKGPGPDRCSRRIACSRGCGCATTSSTG